MIHLDTHVVVWLYAGEDKRFSKKAIREIEQNELYISPAVILELQYLYEIKRITIPGSQIIEGLEVSIGLQISSASFREVMQEAINCSWTRDPFDRMIVAQARTEKAKLLTKDQTILENYRKAFWD